MKIIVINGPNLNFVGIRETSIYGQKNYNTLMIELEEYAKEKNVEVEIMQSNHEGIIIDKIQEAFYNKIDGIIINAGAYTHYSYAIRDAIKSVMIPTVEVHLSDITTREDFRKISVLSDVCIAKMYGKNIDSYKEALSFIINHLSI